MRKAYTESDESALVLIEKLVAVLDGVSPTTLVAQKAITFLMLNQMCHYIDQGLTPEEFVTNMADDLRKLYADMETVQ